MSFLAEIKGISSFKNSDKLCSFIGLIPMRNSSGEHKAVGNITKRQNIKEPYNRMFMDSHT